MGTTEWAISVEFDTESALTASQLDALSDLGDLENVTVARRGGGGCTLLDTRAGDPLQAAEELVQLGAKWAAEIDVRAYMVGVRVMTSEQAEADALAPSVPALASAADAADLLGVSRQRVHQLSKQHPRFPAPIAHVAIGPLWTVDAIQWFASIWERRSGRPPKSRIA
ncbi:MAG TPA: hypothetical protein VGL80_11690 [Pseudonocardiaceae bacterium]